MPDSKPENEKVVETTTETGQVTEAQVVDNPGGASDDDQPVTLSEARRLRRENQKLRGENKDAIAAAAAEAAEKAARQARDEALAQAKAERDAERAEIGRALSQAFGIGLPEETETPPDPKELVEQATAKATEADQRAAAAEQRAAERDRELAVFRLAGDADPHELLDSRSFMRAIRDIDPSADGANAQIKAAIDAAVEANPRLLKDSNVPSRSGGDLSGGNGDPAAGGPVPTDIESLRKRRSARRNRNH